MNIKLSVYASLLVLAGVCSHASAAVLKFTATSTSQGVLGDMTYDESIFDGTSFQYVDNSFILSIDFTDPVTSIHVTTPGPGGQGTYFDSTGALPTVVGGTGFTGGTDFWDGVWIAGTSYVLVAGSSYDDVVWSTAAATLPAPEAATWAMMLCGLGAVGGAMRIRRKAIVSFG